MLKDLLKKYWKWICSIIVLLMFLLVGGPLIINYTYYAGQFVESPFITMWDARDILQYYGIIIASIIAVGGIFITIRFGFWQVKYQRNIARHERKLLEIDVKTQEIVRQTDPLKPKKIIINQLNLLLEDKNSNGSYKNNILKLWLLIENEMLKQDEIRVNVRASFDDIELESFSAFLELVLKLIFNEIAYFNYLHKEINGKLEEGDFSFEGYQNFQRKLLAETETKGLSLIEIHGKMFDARHSGLKKLEVNYNKNMKA